MKAHDILAELLGLLSGALTRVDDIDATVRAVSETASDIGEGITSPAGIDPPAANALAEVLAVERDALMRLRTSLCIARMHVRSLAPALKTGIEVDRLGIPRGGVAG